MNKYASGGHFGDVIHSLYVIKKIYEQTKEKGELYLIQNLEDGHFTRHVKYVCDDIRDVLMKQEYISKVSHEIEIGENYLNLSAWRKSSLLLKVPWTELLTDFYSLPNPNKVEPWIKLDTKNTSVSDKVLIHQSVVEFRKSPYFPWENIIKNNNCIFITYSESEYNNFKFKDMVDVIYMKNFTDCCELLNGCKFYIGNLTSITAIAHAMGIPRLTELISRDALHYRDEYKYFDNYFHICHYNNKNEKYLEGIDKFITL